MVFKTVRDAVHGDVLLSQDELRLIDTATFQRLRGIKQLGTSCLVYPSATHTRFEHSVGTCWTAKRILRAIEEEGTSPPVSAETKRLVAFGALLHDITHVPFGHTFEDERRLLDRHDESSERLEHFLSAPEVVSVLPNREMIRQVLSGSAATAETPPFVSEIIAGTVCADLLDYLKRDAYHCGLRQDYDERLYRYFRLVEDHLVLDLQHDGLFRPDALSELINLLRLRYNLTERVYYHHAKVSSGAMISKALELALRYGALTVGELLNLRDDSFLYLLRERCAKLPAVVGLLDDLASRRLYVRAYMLTTDQPEQHGLDSGRRQELERRFHFNEGNEREQVESDLERDLGLPEGSVILYCPSTDMALKEADVLVRLKAGDILPLRELKLPEVGVLIDKHRQLWRCYVFLRRCFSGKTQECGEACERVFGQANMLRTR